MDQKLTLHEVQQKLEYYCSYQERCHQEVIQKCYDLGLNTTETDTVVVYLLQNNFLNEERFARSFTRGKHRIKQWGKNRIIAELQLRRISSPNIKFALTEISDEDYEATFNHLAEKHWNSLTERKGPKRNKKFCDYLLRRGWESSLVYEKLKELEHHLQ